MSRYLLALAMFLGLSAPVLGQEAPAVPAADVRIAYFSPSRAFAASPEGQRARTQLEALQADRAKEIDVRSKRLQEERAALDVSSTVLAPEARAARERQLQRFQIDLQRFTEDAQAEFLGVQRAAESAFLGKLQPVVDRVAREKRLFLVFDADSGPLFWGDPSLDITGEIVAQLDASK